MMLTMTDQKPQKS